jgi:hypothetical protein
MSRPIIVEDGNARPMTDAELSQHGADQAANEAAEADRAAAEAEAVQARADAIAHAKSFGFTDAMISVMYPSLGL